MKNGRIRICRHWRVGLLVSLFLLEAMILLPAQTPSGKKPGPDACSGKPLEDVLKKTAAFKYGQDRSPLVQLADCVHEAGNSPVLQKELEQRLDAFLQSNSTEDGLRHVCEELSVIGTGSSVPVLSGMLLNPASSDMARYALERIQAPEAGEALLAALPKATGQSKIGIITSLGKRREGQAVPALAKLLTDQDARIALAAAAALGNIADDASRDALRQALSQASGAQRLAVLDAYLLCLDRLARDGKRQEAFNAYLALVRPEEAAPQLIAMARGMVACAEEDMTPRLEVALRQSEVPLIQAEVISQLAAKGTPQAVDLLKSYYPKLPPRQRLQVLAALARSNAAGIQPFFREQATGDEDAEVRAAALEGLGKVGDATCAMLLAETAATAADPEQSAARYSLSTLRGPKVNSLLISNLQTPNPKVQVELIRALGERGATGAASPLMTTLQDPDSKVRRESLRSLREIAEPSQIPYLLSFLTASQEAGERTDAERTIAATLKRHEMGSAPVLARYSLSTNLTARVSLLTVAGMVADKQALPVLQATLKDTQPEVKRAAIAALSDWPTAEPAGDLLAVAGEKPAESPQILALRGYIKLVGLPSKRDNKATVDMLRQALPLAIAAEEKKAILAQLQRYASPEALSLARQMQKDKAVTAEAKLAVKAIQSRLAAEE